MRPASSWLILNPRKSVNTAEQAARQLLEHVAALSPLARQCWNRASRRAFDIGIQAGMGRPFEEVQLPSETLQGIASIGARLQVTVYPPQRA
jgi:hypothetical protein